MRPIIRWLARFGRDPFALLIVFLAGLGTAHILVRTDSYGAAVLTDSIYYLSTALNFLAGEGWQDFTGYPLVAWPPLFPLLLAALGWVGVEPLEAGRWINATAFGLTLLAAGLYLRSHLRSRWLVLAATAVLTTSLPLSDWAANFMTESLFVLFALLALMQLASFLQRGGRTPLLLGAVFTALAALTRYPGVVLIGTGVLLLLVRRAPPLAARLKHAGVFGAVSSIPLAGVLTRNWAVSGTLTGPRSGSGQSLSDALSQAVDVFRAWAIPPNAPDGLGYLLWMVAGLVVLAGARLRHGGKSPSFGLGPVLPFGAFSAIYLVFIVVVVPFTIPYGNGIGSRFLLPIYVPLLLTAALLLDRLLSVHRGGGLDGAVRFVVASLVLLGAVAHVGFSARENLRRTAQAQGAENPAFAYRQQPETLKYLQDHRIEGRIYSNNRPLAWFWNRSTAPEKYQPVRAGLPRLMHDMMQWTEDGTDAHIVWLRAFHDFGHYGYDLTDLRLLPGVEPVAERTDGVVFRVTAAEPFDEAKHRARKQRYVDQLIQQAGEPVVRADWDVYRNGRTLTYFKNPCAPDDTQPIFVLHAIPPTRLTCPPTASRMALTSSTFVSTSATACGSTTSVG